MIPDTSHQVQMDQHQYHIPHTQCLVLQIEHYYLTELHIATFIISKIKTLKQLKILIRLNQPYPLLFGSI